MCSRVLHQPTLLANTTNTAMGIVFMYYQISEPTTVLWGPVAASFEYPFFAISPSLNILLTIMIVTRLILHRRNIQNAMGSSAGTTTGLYRAIVTILVESCALYAASFILFLGPWGSLSSVANIFFPVLAQAQVRAIFYILLKYGNLFSSLRPAGHRTAPHHSTSRRPESIDERECRLQGR